MDSYDNDWLFLDDDLFMIWADEYSAEIEHIKRDCAMQRLEDTE